MPFANVKLSLSCLTGELRREEVVALYGFEKYVGAGPNAVEYPFHCANSAGVISSRNSEFPPCKPKRSSLVNEAVHAERTEVVPENEMRRVPPDAGSPSTVPVPGRIGRIPFTPSGFA